MVLITSTANPRISKLLDLHSPRGRRKQGLFLMEGPHLLQALLDAGMLPREIYYQPALLGRTAQGRELQARVQGLALPRGALVEVSERVIEALGEAQTSQGLVMVLASDTFKSETLRARRVQRYRPALLILDGLADPGNMGTVLRTALAADVEAVLLTPDCVDAYSPKVMRAAAGAHVALPIALEQGWQALEQRVVEHCGGEPRVLLAEAGSPHLYYEQDLRSPFALIVGNEAHGPSQQAHALATRSISIPLANGVESLNAAMAAGIVLYEAVRQQGWG